MWCVPVHKGSNHHALSHSTLNAAGPHRPDVEHRGLDRPSLNLHLASEPRLFATSPADVERRYLEYMARLEPRLPDYFRILPRAGYGVARLTCGDVAFPATFTVVVIGG